MNILVTGFKGQLGSELHRNLIGQATELGALPEALKGASVNRVDLPEADISNLEQMRGIVEQNKPNVIINCAAYTNVDGCEADPDTALKVNALGARNMAVLANECGAKLIHISTDYVFPGDGRRPYQEWDMCGPNNVYGYSKLLGEQYVREFCDRYFIVRTAWLYGYEGGNFVKTILRIAKDSGELNVVDDQHGNPTNAADLAHHLLKLAAIEQYGIYHCTNNGECSWYEFAREIIRLAGFDCIVNPCTSAEFPRPAMRPAYSGMDNTMLRATVGDEMRSWQDAIAAYMSHYNKITGGIEW